MKGDCVANTNTLKPEGARARRHTLPADSSRQRWQEQLQARWQNPAAARWQDREEVWREHLQDAHDSEVRAGKDCRHDAVKLTRAADDKKPWWKQSRSEDRDCRDVGNEEVVEIDDGEGRCGTNIVAVRCRGDRRGRSHVEVRLR